MKTTNSNTDSGNAAKAEPKKAYAGPSIASRPAADLAKTLAEVNASTGFVGLP